jgi:hypothetical protein
LPLAEYRPLSRPCAPACQTLTLAPIDPQGESLARHRMRKLHRSPPQLCHDHRKQNRTLPHHLGLHMMRLAQCSRIGPAGLCSVTLRGQLSLTDLSPSLAVGRPNSSRRDRRTTGRCRCFGRSQRARELEVGARIGHEEESALHILMRSLQSKAVPKALD